MKAPKAKDGLAARILTEEEVQRRLAHAPAGRDGLLLRLLYVAGVRAAAEPCGLTWNDTSPRNEAGTRDGVRQGR